MKSLFRFLIFLAFWTSIAIVPCSAWNDALGSNERLNDACNYWANTGRCPAGYAYDSVSASWECPCNAQKSSEFYQPNQNTPIFSNPQSSNPTKPYLFQTYSNQEYLPIYSSGTTIDITNDLGYDATVVWTIKGTKNKVFTANIQKGRTKTINTPVGTFDEYIKADRWYKAGSDTFDAYHTYTLRYYKNPKSGLGTTLIPINEKDAPII